MRTVIKKRGTSAWARIPGAVLRAAHLQPGDTVEVWDESGRVVIEPVHGKEYSSVELVKGISPRNLHDEVNSAGPVGKEVW